MDEKKLIEQKIFNDTSAYQSIMDFPYQHPKRHLPMNSVDRAFQFSPFGALEGFSDLIKEKTKDYTRKKYLTDSEETQIHKQLDYLQKHSQKVDVNYFNDRSGYYEHVKGYLQKIDRLKGRATFDQTSIIIVNIRSIRLIQEEK